jgi:MazG family protein
MARRPGTGRERRGAQSTARRRSTPRRPRQRARPSSSNAAGEAFQKLVDTVRTLHEPGGCPWDREQTIETLRPFVLEETYEVLDAIDRHDHTALRGEIGDFVFEGVFLAQLESQHGHFTITDSIRAITEKLVRRHPHVFGTSSVRTPGEVLEQWEAIKAREQQSAGGRKAVLAGLPKSLPALLAAYEIGTRVGAVGFDWERADDVIGKIREEVDELERAAKREGAARVEEEMGDLLFAIANLARKLGVEPESALRKANHKFAARFDKLERHLEETNRTVHDATLEEMEVAWGAVKSRER